MQPACKIGAQTRKSLEIKAIDPEHLLFDRRLSTLPKILRRRSSMKVFAYSKWDAVCVLCGLLHFAYVITFFFVFPYAPWWLLICMGIIYSVSVSWNINGVSHNLIHNPFFKSRILNRLFGVMESVTLGISQTFYKHVHHRHHMGNSDRPDENGETHDWISIYRHGHDGEAENPWSYIFLSYLREDPKRIYREMKRKNPVDARWGIIEIVILGATIAIGFVLDWKFWIFFLPFYYLGHCCTYLNGFFLHYGGNPDKPIAWGVSSYDKWYNLLWFNNGYHAEHHYRPKLHWTKMDQFHHDILEQQRKEGVRVITPPHALGFLDPNLPPRKYSGRSSRSPSTADAKSDAPSVSGEKAAESNP
jgi:fatty acid desaturase